jgi:hypothetical protein
MRMTHAWNTTNIPYFSTNLNMVAHTIAIYHVVAMGILRYMSIVTNIRITAFTYTRLALTSAAIFIITPILCIPMYIMTTVDQWYVWMGVGVKSVRVWVGEGRFVQMTSTCLQVSSRTCTIDKHNRRWTCKHNNRRAMVRTLGDVVANRSTIQLACILLLSNSW